MSEATAVEEQGGNVGRFVLIADGNSERGQRLAEACARAGIEAKVVTHGAAALELALNERPQLVVAELDLPLVDARKLSEILRANPHTRRARFIFLQDDPGQAERQVGDWTLSASSVPDALVEKIQEAMVRQDRIESIDEQAEGGGQVEGDLGQLPLADLLQLFHVNQRSGRLLLSRDAKEGISQAFVLLQDGDVIRAEAGSAEGEKALFRLLTWREGSFRFEAGDRGESPAIFAPTRALLGEGLRQLKEWDRLAPQLPAMDSPLRLKVKSSELPNIVHPLTQEVLILLEMYSRVRDVVDHCSFPDYQVLRTLHTLEERGILRIGRVPMPGPAHTSEGLLNLAQAQRLRSWLQEESPRGEAPPAAKVVVAASEPGALQDFVNLMRTSPQIRVAPEWEAARGALPEDSLARIAQVAVDDDISIELFHLPRDARFAPLWPRVGYGALSVLFLLSGRLADAAERVREMSEAMRGLPKLRIFYVALLHKGDRITPDDIKEQAVLMDEMSLYLLALESDRDPDAQLRGLLARVVR